jgi:hypothetical protein
MKDSFFFVYWWLLNYLKIHIMKTKTVLCAAFLGILFLSSCKKDSTSTPKQNCKINSVTLDSLVINFFYNPDGKISSIIEGVGADTISYTYSANVMAQTDGTSIKTSQISSSGEVLKTNYSSYGTIFWEEDYEYDNNNNLVKVTSIFNGNLRDIVTFTWSNGNMILATLNGNEAETFTYYTDKPSRTVILLI